MKFISKNNSLIVDNAVLNFFESTWLLIWPEIWQKDIPWRTLLTDTGTWRHIESLLKAMTKHDMSRRNHGHSE